MSTLAATIDEIIRDLEAGLPLSDREQLALRNSGRLPRGVRKDPLKLAGMGYGIDSRTLEAYFKRPEGKKNLYRSADSALGNLSQDRPLSLEESTALYLISALAGNNNMPAARFLEKTLQRYNLNGEDPFIKLNLGQITVEDYNNLTPNLGEEVQTHGIGGKAYALGALATLMLALACTPTASPNAPATPTLEPPTPELSPTATVVIEPTLVPTTTPTPTSIVPTLTPIPTQTPIPSGDFGIPQNESITYEKGALTENGVFYNLNVPFTFSGPPNAQLELIVNGIGANPLTVSIDPNKKQPIPVVLEPGKHYDIKVQYNARGFKDNDATNNNAVISLYVESFPVLKRDEMFAQHNDKAFLLPSLGLLADYQNPTQENLSSLIALEQLLSDSRADVSELARRAVVATADMNQTRDISYDRGVEKITKPFNFGSKEIVGLINILYLKHHSDYGRMDPTGGVPSTFDIKNALLGLNATESVQIPDGTRVNLREIILSSKSHREMAIAMMDREAWLAVPWENLRNTPSWVYVCPGTNPGSFVVSNLPFAPTSNNDIRHDSHPYKFNGGCIDPKLWSDSQNAFTSNPELHDKFNPVREEWLQKFDFVPNEAEKLERLAKGRYNPNEEHFSFDEKYRSVTLERIADAVYHLSQHVDKVAVPYRRFMGSKIGDLEVAFMRGAIVRTTEELIGFTKTKPSEGTGGFRSLDSLPGIEETLLEIKGNVIRVNEKIPGGRSRYNMEPLGLLVTLRSESDPGEDTSNNYSHATFNSGQLVIQSFGEPYAIPVKDVSAFSPVKVRYGDGSTYTPFPIIDQEGNWQYWQSNKASITTNGKTRGAAFVFDLASVDEGYNPEPLFANDEKARNRGPWMLVYDDREGQPIKAEMQQLPDGTSAYRLSRATPQDVAFYRGNWQKARYENILESVVRKMFSQPHMINDRRRPSGQTGLPRAA